tara:strand:- start:1869 stop:1991 length:123 start_codon:yes stop_codon:yes gene_type:complete
LLSVEVLNLGRQDELGKEAEVPLPPNGGAVAKGGGCLNFV